MGANGAAVVREVDLPADVREVWDALTDPEQVAGWFGAEVAWELRPGGPARFTGDDGEQRSGEVDEVEQDRRLAYRWWPEGDDAATTAVRYELEPIPGGTRLTIIEAPSPIGGVGGTTASLRAAAGSAWDVPALLLWARCHESLMVRA